MYTKVRVKRCPSIVFHLWLSPNFIGPCPCLAARLSLSSFCRFPFLSSLVLLANSTLLSLPESFSGKLSVFQVAHDDSLSVLVWARDLLRELGCKIERKKKAPQSWLPYIINFYEINPSRSISLTLAILAIDEKNSSASGLFEECDQLNDEAGLSEESIGSKSTASDHPSVLDAVFELSPGTYKYCVVEIIIGSRN